MVNEGSMKLGDKVKQDIADLGIANELKEGVDFTINADGNLVFSRWYLLRRSYCCKNYCINCPY